MMFGIICSKVLQEKRLLRGREVAKGDKRSWCGLGRGHRDVPPTGALGSASKDCP